MQCLLAIFCEIWSKPRNDTCNYLTTLQACCHTAGGAYVPHIPNLLACFTYLACLDAAGPYMFVCPTYLSCLCMLCIPASLVYTSGTWPAWMPYIPGLLHCCTYPTCFLSHTNTTCMYANRSHMGAMCRLLAWATDIVTQLEHQRQELRRSRMELASAQEVCPKLPSRPTWYEWSQVQLPVAHWPLLVFVMSITGVLYIVSGRGFPVVSACALGRHCLPAWQTDTWGGVDTLTALCTGRVLLFMYVYKAARGSRSSVIAASFLTWLHVFFHLACRQVYIVTCQTIFLSQSHCICEHQLYSTLVSVTCILNLSMCMTTITTTHSVVSCVLTLWCCCIRPCQYIYGHPPCQRTPLGCNIVCVVVVQLALRTRLGHS